MTGRAKGNSEFYFPQTLNVPRRELQLKNITNAALPRSLGALYIYTQVRNTTQINLIVTSFITVQKWTRDSIRPTCVFVYVILSLFVL